jgi:hypothetical protein
VEKPKPRQESLDNRVSTPKPQPEVVIPAPSDDLVLDLALEVELQGLEAELIGLESLPLARRDTGRIRTVKARISEILRRLGR